MVEPTCKLVMIEWQDSELHISRWSHLSDFNPMPPMVCVSVGWMVQSDHGAVTLAANMGGTNRPDNLQMSSVITIPKRCILKIHDIKEPRLESTKRNHDRAARGGATDGTDAR